MAKFGINVPEGSPAFSVEEVGTAAKALADEKGEVRRCRSQRYIAIGLYC